MAKCKNCMNFKLVDEKKTKYKFCPCTMDSKDPDEERECAFYKHMTNGDRIRNMTDEELAEFITIQFCHGIGKDLIAKWLQMPVEVVE